ncbi:MAG: LuxR C-terminal-related transcriptional regulator [Actinomycetota bacterium]|nr:LuxR C-terminal-related transcriptional regulator [Actinomycetota bacterium]
MTTALAGDDLARISDLLSRASAAPTGHDGLPDELLLGLVDLVPCDAAGFLDADVASGQEYVLQVSDGRSVRRLAPVANDPFYDLYWTSSFCSYPTRTGDDRSVTLLSDFYSQRQWQTTPMYAEVFRDEGLQHELMCCLPTTGSRVRRVLMSRSRGSDFDERDRMLMALLRPHLAELYRSQSTAASPGLTPRQTELMRLVAAGRTTPQIAELLFLSQGTVRKHLENIFDRLGVTSRAAAVMRVFADEV